AQVDRAGERALPVLQSERKRNGGLQGGASAPLRLGLDGGAVAELEGGGEGEAGTARGPALERKAQDHSVSERLVGLVRERALEILRGGVAASRGEGDAGLVGGRGYGGRERAVLIEVEGS